MSFDQTTVAAYLEVITINLVLSGDNRLVETHKAVSPEGSGWLRRIGPMPAQARRQLI